MYELLIRGSDNGTQIRGAHVIDAVGQVPRPVAVADISRWLDEAAALAITQLEQLADVVAERDALQARVAELEAQLAAPALVVPMHKFRMALAATPYAGGGSLLQALEGVIGSAPEPHRSRMQIAFEYAPTVARNSELVAAAAAILGLTDQQLDALFATAAAITT